MIKKLAHRLIKMATIAIILLMSMLTLIMNIVNYTSVLSECDLILEMLCQQEVNNNFDMPDLETGGGIKSFFNKDMSPEAPYEARYFTVLLSPSGTVLKSDLSKTISVDEDSADEYITKAILSDKDTGFIKQFRFQKMTTSAGTKIVFLDCTRVLDSFKTFLWTSIFVSIFGCLIVILAFLFFSKRIVSPIAESYEKQKRFISDASHEIKTPLTIIRANLDLLEPECDKEEVTEIREQTDRLTKLTNDLVSLSKMQEKESSLQKMEMPLSDIVNETISTFQAPALANGLELAPTVTTNVTINGSPNDIRQLCSILIDNAIKYAKKDSKVKVNMHPSKKNVIIEVTNETENEVKSSNLSQIFDRFYRTDESRNSETGGHGIGLSIAKAIVDAHGGTISASTKDGHDFTITATIPTK